MNTESIFSWAGLQVPSDVAYIKSNHFKEGRAHNCLVPGIIYSLSCGCSRGPGPPTVGWAPTGLQRMFTPGASTERKPAEKPEYHTIGMERRALNPVYFRLIPRALDSVNNDFKL